MLAASYSGKFKKEVQLLQKRGKKMDKLKTVINLLLNKVTGKAGEIYT